MEKTPQQRGKSSRTKGARVEREIVAMLQEAGLPAEKVSRSGYSTHDIMIGDELSAEVKARKGGDGFKTIERWAEGVDVLFLKSNHSKPLAVIPFSLFTQLMSAYLSQDK